MHLLGFLPTHLSAGHAGWSGLQAPHQQSGSRPGMSWQPHQAGGLALLNTQVSCSVHASGSALAHSAAGHFFLSAAHS